MDNVAPGTHEVEVVYSGDDKYANATKVVNVTAPKYDSPVSIEVSEIKSGENGTVTVTVGENATGTVTVSVDGKEYTVDVINGTATVEIGNLTGGPKTIVVEYSGDDNYASNYTVGNFTVVPSPVLPDMSVVDYGNGTVEIVLPEDAAGNVTVTVDGKNFTAEVINGTAVIQLDNVAPGTHEVVVTYSGDDKYSNITKETNVTAPKYDSTIGIDVSEIKSGEDGTITVTLPENATGTVTVSVDGKEYTADVVNGAAVVKVDNLTAGPKTVVVEYSGDDNYTSGYAVGNFTVEPSKVTPDVTVVDQGNGTIVVVVPSDAIGNVTVKVGDNEYNATVVDGKAVIQLDNVTPGEHEIEVIYSGDDKYTNATATAKVTAPKLDTPITVEAKDSLVGDKSVITVEVPKGATGSITIEIDGEQYTADIKDGKAIFEIDNLIAGTKTIAVDYAGDDNYVANHTAGKTTVSKRPSTVTATVDNITVGENVTVTVKVPTDATGQVLIDVDGVGYYVNVTDGIGVAQIPRIPEGVYYMTITYAGDDKYLPSSNTVDFNVSKIESFVIPVAQDILVGENEVITLTVPKDATGIVTVVIDGVEYVFDLSDGTLSASGDGDIYSVAVYGDNGILVISGLPKGEYVVSAKYEGDDKYLSATNTTTFTVSKQDTDLDIVDLGNGTIVINAPSDATGNVTVKVGNETYTAELVNGTAVINMDNTTPGTHKAEVIYSGDENYSSKTVETNVSIPKYTTPISVEVHDINVGENETVIVTLPDGATGSVTIEINGVKYTANVENGKATFNVSGLKEGKKTVAVRYDGDDSYEWNSTTAQFTVSKVKSTTDAEGKDITVGKDEVITVHVPHDATGRVLVDIDGIGYYGTIVNGKAKIVIPDLEAGKYTAKVTYEGDDKYLPSSDTVKFTVSKAKAPVSAWGDDIVVGDDASVVVNLPSDATGTVTITVEGKKYVSKVIDGKAVFYVPGLSAGKHEVLIHYSGDKKYDSNDTITYIVVKDHGKHHKHHDISYDASSKEGISLSVHETGNPIWILLLVIFAMGTTQIRRFRK